MTIDFTTMDPTIRRRAKAAQDANHLAEPTHETMRCPCGYNGAPEAIIRYSEWADSDTDFDLFVCPECGGA